jgi:hypothetical protein
MLLAVIITAAVILGLALAATAAVVALRLRHRRALGAARVAPSRPVPWQRAEPLSAPKRPAIEAPRQDLHLQFHGVTAEDVAAILAARCRDCDLAGCRTLPDDAGMSMTAAATATASLWPPVIAAAVGAGAVLLAAAFSQWSSRQLQKEQWDQERTDRQEQWGRERASRREQSCQQAYAELIAEIYRWDDVLLEAQKVREDDTEHYAAGKAAADGLPLVVFLAPPPIRAQAIAAIKERNRFWLLRLMRSPKREKIDIRKRDDDWKALLAKRDLLLNAMQSDTGLGAEVRAGESQDG